MKGLLLKDYYMLLKYCRPYALIVLIFGVCSLADGGNLFMLAYPAVYAVSIQYLYWPMMKKAGGSNIVRQCLIRENR